MTRSSWPDVHEVGRARDECVGAGSRPRGRDSGHGMAHGGLHGGRTTVAGADGLPGARRTSGPRLAHRRGPIHQDENDDARRWRDVSGRGDLHPRSATPARAGHGQRRGEANDVRGACALEIKCCRDAFSGTPGAKPVVVPKAGICRRDNGLGLPASGLRSPRGRTS